jgi:polar amino acid transport system substrate-binding protein
MQQLTQKLKNGDMKILEVPAPLAGPGLVRVKTYYSLISAGTEGSTVKAARKSLLGKARERPQQVRQVMDTLKAQGPVQTYRAVMKKLDAYSPLGYSCVGEVVDPGGSVRFKQGDLVACGGLSAAHAEIVSVPENLCVKLDPDTDLKQAVYNTLGAIALQGVRQADLKLGETCTIVGLGLLGQITGLLLRASGIRVIGIDIDPAMVAIAQKNCLDMGFTKDNPGLEAQIMGITQGMGCDGVIITAATDSLDPINFAGAVLRKKGTAVVVGDVPVGFDREPYFYKKELQVKMSCSYGPGRYDPIYEDKGIDYPSAYVRWTENRNMQAFQNLICTGKINLNYLTTHTFDLENAPNAYHMMMEKSAPFIGILIAYDQDKPFEGSKILLRPSPRVKKSAEVTAACTIGFIGAGSYALSHLLPNIPQEKNVVKKGIITHSGISSRSVAERFGFEFCTDSKADILSNPDINTVFITTRHDSHADLVIEALGNGKQVFVEKPLCLTPEQLAEIAGIMGGSQRKRPGLMVGYNRRFAPLAVKLKNAVGSGPMAMSYRINAGSIPRESWIQDRETGGGRIIGEACHFIDFLTFINGSLPVSISAQAMANPDHLNDTATLSITYANGSIGTILYFSNGDKGLAKERIEVFANGLSAVLDDFKNLGFYRQGKKKQHKLMSQDKGQKEEVRQFISSVILGQGPLIPFEEIYTTSAAAFAALDSLGSGNTISF